jgi:hypothetical protein
MSCVSTTQSPKNREKPAHAYRGCAVSARRTITAHPRSSERRHDRNAPLLGAKHCVTVRPQQSSIAMDSCSARRVAWTPIICRFESIPR